jgi:hypothetical protein
MMKTFRFVRHQYVSPQCQARNNLSHHEGLLAAATPSQSPSCSLPPIECPPANNSLGTVKFANRGKLGFAPNA